jgi:GLE1-like protein
MLCHLQSFQPCEGFAHEQQLGCKCHARGRQLPPLLRRTIKEGEQEGQLEGDDAFIKHTRGLLRFYGTVLQYQDLPQAWTFVASFVNQMPANVYTGTALVAFLETAGFALSQRCGRQFIKLLQVRAHDHIHHNLILHRTSSFV